MDQTTRQQKIRKRGKVDYQSWTDDEERDQICSFLLHINTQSAQLNVVRIISTVRSSTNIEAHLHPACLSS